MSGKPSPTPVADLRSRYDQLPAGEAIVMRLKSLIEPPIGKTPFVECLARSDIRPPEGRVWSPQTLNPILDSLRHQGLLTDNLGCVPALLHEIAVEAMRTPEGVALANAARRGASGQQGGFDHLHNPRGMVDMLSRRMRLAIYANDETEFSADCALVAKNYAPYRAADLLAGLFVDAKLAIEWLAERHVAIQLALFEIKLLAFLCTGTADPGLPALLAHYRNRQRQDAFAPVRVVLLRYDLLAGRLDGVRRALPQGDAPDVWRAGLAFLEGRNAEALGLYRDTLKLRRKLEGRRKIFLDGEHGLFFLMTMLKAHDPSLHRDIQAGLDVALSGPKPYTSGLLALQALLWLVQGLEAKARDMLGQLRRAMPVEPLSAACVALAEYAVDAALSRTHRNDLAARFAPIKDTLAPVARIYAEILAEVAITPAPYAAHLAADDQGFGVVFTDIIQTRQPWERALENLDSFLFTAPAAGPEAVPRKAKRLAWFIDPTDLEVDVAEQAAKGRDGWSDGRAIALKRLHDRDPRLAYLTTQDLAALRGLRRRSGGWYGDDDFEFDPLRTIPALIGHEAVFDARHRHQPIELVAASLELVIAEKRGGYHVALSHSADAPTIFVEAETPTRYRVVEFPQRMLAVQEMLGRGLVVPTSARDRLIALVQRANPALPIRAEIAALGHSAQEGQSAPVVQLVPDGDGLKVSLLVRPFGAEGPAYVAGLGGRSVLANVGDAQLRANRDLPRELSDRAALIAACPTLRDRSGMAGHEVVIDDVEGCLDLLLELQAITSTVTVEWPQGQKMKVSALAPGGLRLRVAKDRDWFSVEGTVTVDADQVVEMRFLLDRLDRAKGRFVPLGDGSFIALTRQLQAHLGRLAAVSEPHRTGRRVHALGAPALRDLLEDAGEVKTDTAWTRHVGRIQAAEGWTPKLPPTLQAELRDYQIEGFAWLSRLARWGAGACLADDMGLGKTVQAIAVLLDHAADGPSLVVAPTSVCPNWQNEMARFAPTLTTHRLAVATDRAALVAGLGPRDVLVCSYGLLQQEAELLGGKAWQVAVLDEAQAIKNARSKRAQASIGLQAQFRLALTGTPMENYLDELWSLFNFVNPGLLGSHDGFQKRFSGPIERDQDANARHALRALIRPFLLRRTKAAVLSELPPRTEQTLLVEMDDAERTFYEALRQAALESITALESPRGRRKLHILAEITRLRRACCNPALIDQKAGVPSSKLAAFLELVEDLIRNRHRALVFSQFVGHLELVRAALDARGISYAYLDGSTPSAERERLVASFQGGGADLFLISLRAGGTGLNLTAADYVVHLDPWWNPAVEDQASDRTHRIGQERPVTIYRLIMRDSIEEQILSLHHHKRNLASDLLEGAESSGRLSEDELLGLIQRR